MSENSSTNNWPHIRWLAVNNHLNGQLNIKSYLFSVDFVMVAIVEVAEYVNNHPPSPFRSDGSNSQTL